MTKQVHRENTFEMRNYIMKKINVQIHISSRNHSFLLNNIFSFLQKRIDELKKQPYLYHKYQQLDENWKSRFIKFMTGKKTLPLTYDPFF